MPCQETQLVEMQCGAGRLAAPPRAKAPLVKFLLVQAPRVKFLLLQAHPVWVRVSVQYL